MSALQKMTDAGFVIELAPSDQLDIAPASKLTGAQLQWVRDNKARLLAELHAANEVQVSWDSFVDECVRHDVTAYEMGAMFSVDDTDAMPLSDLALFVKTAVDAIQQKRVLDPEHCIDDPSRVFTFNGPVIKRCAECQHFRRLDHPHLGRCDAGEPEGATGNWDFDNRNYCGSYSEVVL